VVDGYDYRWSPQGGGECRRWDVPACVRPAIEHGLLTAEEGDRFISGTRDEQRAIVKLADSRIASIATLDLDEADRVQADGSS
jgi:hypothetical protein